MGMEVGESYMKKTLRSLCFSHGWSYGVFWRFDPQNHMLLTVEDAYFEGHVANLMNNMVVQVHVLGEGMIGEAALDGRHRWVFLDSSLGISEFNLQFSSGMKTVAVIPVELRGVVQFGSTKDIFETPEFLDQARRFLQNNNNFAGVNSLLSSTSWTNGAEDCSLFDSQFPGDMFGEPFGPVHFPPPSLETCQADDFSQWLADSTKLCVTGLDLEAMLSDEMLSDLGSIPGKQPVCSSQSSLTNVIDSCGEGKPYIGGANELLTDFGMDFSCGELGDVINGVDDRTNSKPVISTGMAFSECIPEVGGCSAAALKKGLFSELGLEHLLKDGSSSSSGARSCVEDLWSTPKKRKTEAYQTLNNQIQPTQIQPNYQSWGVKSMQPTSAGGQMQDFGSLKECLGKAQGRSWIDESFSADAKSCISGVNAQTRKNEEPSKTTKKRARPGESTRPRPKDRQLIADRIKDLRDLIPNGAKLSIDALLNRTIKHMVFLQNLNKHADKLKQVDEPKLINQENSLIQKGSSSVSSVGNGRRNATWAYEVGSSNILCPIIVEDLNEPGQMLIEMLCEERGYFLEIADIVRGFGLTILKGIMEARNDKIWAHFIVEGNKHVTRMEVFVSLMQLLHGSNSNTREVVNTKQEPANTVTNPAPLWGDFQQRVLALPI
nr:hypothetical protein [Suaeda aralocaspica]